MLHSARPPFVSFSLWALCLTCRLFVVARSASLFSPTPSEKAKTLRRVHSAPPPSPVPPLPPLRPRVLHLQSKHEYRRSPRSDRHRSRRVDHDGQTQHHHLLDRARSRHSHPAGAARRLVVAPVADPNCLLIAADRRDVWSWCGSIYSREINGKKKELKIPKNPKKPQKTQKKRGAAKAKRRLEREPSFFFPHVFSPLFSLLSTLYVVFIAHSERGSPPLFPPSPKRPQRRHRQTAVVPRATCAALCARPPRLTPL